MAETIPPPLQGPTAKERKYDRQLRLWAANGQAALENAHVLLINSGTGAVGTEALKNLILPGVGQFTILDPHTVTEADLGVNFFLTEDDLGSFRAERCCRLLQELNPDVQGHFVTESFDSLALKQDALLPYSLLLVVLPVKPETLNIISSYSQKCSIPAFYVNCVGFYSHFTVQMPHAFPIVDTHPDPATTTDLRLLEPWPELLEIMHEKTSNLDLMDDETHGHIPFVLLLLYHLEQWKEEHGGSVPQNYKQKTEFRELVRSSMRTNTPEGSEENFEEAIGAVLKNLNPSTPSSAVKEVFEADECKDLTQQSHSDDFWIIARAISEFYDRHSVLPVSGSLPDMKAKSADYIALQSVYKAKARKDIAEVSERVVALEKTLGRSVSVDPKVIEAFCKSCGYVKLVRGRLPHLANLNSTHRWGDRAEFASSALVNPGSLILLYISFLAYDFWAANHSQDGLVAAGPGLSDEDFDIRVVELKDIAFKFLNDLMEEAKTVIKEPIYSEMTMALGNYAEELIRTGGGELHNIAALTGGMVAEEVIKVITKQYIPVDNTCIFDGILSQASVLRL